LGLQTFEDLIPYPVVPNNRSLKCYNISGVQQPEFPSVSLQFSGVNGTTVDFPLAEQNVFLPADDGTVQCLAIVPGDFRINIIGNIAQADHYIETDLVDMKIGWTSKDCSLPM
jgi:hypothetical protein